jgi:hypothetical protein
MVRKRAGRKWALGTRAPMVIPQGRQPALEPRLVSDALTDARDHAEINQTALIR